MKRTKRILSAAIITYLALCMVLFVMQRNMMYFPGGLRQDVLALTNKVPQILTVQSEGDIVFNAWHWQAEDAMSTIVFFHGNGQAYQHWVNKMMIYHDQGYGIFFVDYRGYGGVAGKPSEQGLYSDARAHIDTFIKETGIQPSDLIYYGESLGTGIATQMATEYPPKAIIYESAYSATTDVAKSRYWMFPVEMLMKDKYRSIDKMEALKMPKFFIHAEKDMLIPMRYGRALFEAAPPSKGWVSIPDAGHNNLYDHGAGLQISSFLRSLLWSNNHQDE